LERDGYLCQGCHDRTATIAHLFTYAHVGREFLFDLVALCRDCHERFHRQDGREMSGRLPVEEYEFQATFTDDERVRWQSGGNPPF
jgi:5-methylcytosine-specific restriction endonuclease McrA